MKIGVGITTVNRPLHIAKCLEMLNRFNTVDYKIFVKVDLEKRGVAYSKNICLEELFIKEGCTHVFLLDDDCFPIVEDWFRPFISSSFNHLCYLTARHKPFFNEGTASYYHESGGCMMYLTKEVFDKVGYYNPNYVGYGYEHSGYSKRIARANLIPHAFISLNNTEKYFHSFDYNGEQDYGIKHYGSLELSEINENLKDNKQLFNFECNLASIYQKNKD